MTHTYKVEGMTCEGCVSSVKSKLLALPDVRSADVSKNNSSATIEMAKHISVSDLQNALGGKTSKYQISAGEQEKEEIQENWFKTYKPILVIFGYVGLLSTLLSFNTQTFSLTTFMRIFMAGFFLIFSFFKMLDLKGFAESYSMYDVIAKKFFSWGYIYAFIELALGICFALAINPFVTNLVTVIVMSISLIGVLQSVLNKKKIQCACLGAVFNLPMSTVTIVEDALMILMSATMLLLM